MNYHDYLSNFLNINLNLKIENKTSEQMEKFEVNQELFICNYLLNLANKLLHLFKEGVKDGYLEKIIYIKKIRSYLDNLNRNSDYNINKEKFTSDYLKFLQKLPNNLGFEINNIENYLESLTHVCTVLFAKNKELLI